MKFIRNSLFIAIIKLTILLAIFIATIVITVTILDKYKILNLNSEEQNSFHNYLIVLTVIMLVITGMSFVKTIVSLILSRKRKFFWNINLNKDDDFELYIISMKWVIIRLLIALSILLFYIYLYVKTLFEKGKNTPWEFIIFHIIGFILLAIYIIKFSIILAFKILMKKDKDWHKLHNFYLLFVNLGKGFIQAYKNKHLYHLENYDQLNEEQENTN